MLQFTSCTVVSPLPFSAVAGYVYYILNIAVEGVILLQQVMSPFKSIMLVPDKEECV